MIAIQSVYEQYQVPPHLARHMVMTASVADWLLSVSNGSLDDTTVIETMLLHDLANILKFDWKVPPEVFGWNQEMAVEYQQVAASIAARYGNDEVGSTLTMMNELRVMPEVKALFVRISQRKSKPWQPDEWEVKIAWYSDMRVGPRGLTSVTERFEDGLARYGNKPNFDLDRFYSDQKLCQDLESQLTEKLSINLDLLEEDALQGHVSKVAQWHLRQQR